MSVLRQIILDPVEPTPTDPDGLDVYAVILSRAIRHIASGALIEEWQVDEDNRIAKAKRTREEDARTNQSTAWSVFRRALIHGIQRTQAAISRLHPDIDWRVRHMAMNTMLSQIWRVVVRNEELMRLCELVAEQRHAQKLATAATIALILQEPEEPDICSPLSST